MRSRLTDASPLGHAVASQGTHHAIASPPPPPPPESRLRREGRCHAAAGGSHGPQWVSGAAEPLALPPDGFLAAEVEFRLPGRVVFEPEALERCACLDVPVVLERPLGSVSAVGESADKGSDGAGSGGWGAGAEGVDGAVIAR